MECYWINQRILDEIKSLALSPPRKEIFQIVFVGERGIGEHDCIQFYLSHYPSEKIILNELDFSFQNFSVAAFLYESFKYYLESHPEFERFLSNFTKHHQKYIRRKLENLLIEAENNIDWYLEIYLEFLAFKEKTHSFFMVFENVDQIDQQKIEKLQQFLNNFREFPIQIIYSLDTEAYLKRSIPAAEEVFLSKLSIQSVEKAIQKFYDASVVNARLITNHCYLKSGGNPFKITLLLTSLYRSILKPQQKGFVNLKKLQKLKVPETWEELFNYYCRAEERTAGKILALLTLLEEPISEKDVKTILSKLKVKNSFYHKWVELGILKHIHHQGEKCIGVNQIHFAKWVKREIPVEELSDLLMQVAQIQLAGKLRRVYQLSDFLHRCHQTKLAMILAEREGRYYYHQGNFIKAADRLYFVTRISESETTVLPNLNQILELLGDIYLQIGSYENAFEIFKRYRSAYCLPERGNESSAKSKWLEINLKMAKTLVEMDSFHEARYLIRETRVKQFCHPRIIGQCYDLLGDIEVNLAHSSQAIQHYRKALSFYREGGTSANLYQLYFKLKALLSENSHQQLELVQQIIGALTKDAAYSEFKSILLRDKINLLLQNKALDKALRNCHELQQLLKQLYQPKLEVQLMFYLGEVYAQRGKWNSALDQLTQACKKIYVIHRPDFHVQTLIQLALIYKEQALYGNALRILYSAKEIAQKKGFSEQINEIKLHLGHIYLLVYNFLKAFESLGEVKDWANKHQKSHLSFMARLYLSYYEIRHKRMERARRLLSESKKILDLNFNLIDYLNYLFYLAIWLIHMNRQQNALRVIDQLLFKSKRLPRYQTSGYYLRGMAEFRLQKTNQSRKSLNKALALSSRWSFPQIRYLILCEQARQSEEAENPKFILSSYRKACRYIRSLAEKMGDDILSTQFLESQAHEDILSFFKK